MIIIMIMLKINKITFKIMIMQMVFFQKTKTKKKSHLSLPPEIEKKPSHPQELAF